MFNYQKILTETINYNSVLIACVEDRETILFLRNENANLHEEVKRLEQDLINLHNKRIQDVCVHLKKYFLMLFTIVLFKKITICT